MSSPKRKAPPAPSNLDELAELFEEALRLDPQPRAKWLANLRRRRPSVALEIESLLEAHEKSPGFLDEPIGPRLAAAFEREAAPPSLPTGEVFGDFEILRLLGSGGFASVYLARQTSLGREVALKVSSGHARGHEARLMANLEHDHIVKVFSESVDNTHHLNLICMQYVPGASLASILHEIQVRPLSRLDGATLLEIIDSLNDSPVLFDPAAFRYRDRLAGFDLVEAVLWIGARLADALDHAHQKEILHLDVKPGNILISPYGRPMLSDFNVSFSKQQQDREPLQQVLGGTMAYMAPEQASHFLPEGGSSNAVIDHRADIYSLGTVLLEVIARGERAVGTGQAEISDQRRRHWETVLRRCRREKPEDRYPTAAALSAALHGCLEVCRIQKALPPASRLTRLCFRHPIFSLTLFALVPQLIGSAINILYNQVRIVSHLTGAQQEQFRWLLVVYNPIIYFSCVAFWFWQLSELQRYLKADPENIGDPTKIRRHILRLPIWVVGITSLGWLPACVVFPEYLNLQAGPLSASVFRHFVVSFMLSWLVAASYSGLYTQFICLRVLYPRFWLQSSQVQKTAGQELSTLGTRLRAFYFLVGFIPLIGAIAIIYSGPDRWDAQSYGAFSSLPILLITVGMAGVYVGFRRVNQLAQTLYALTGRHGK